MSRLGDPEGMGASDRRDPPLPGPRREAALPAAALASALAAALLAVAGCKRVEPVRGERPLLPPHETYEQQLREAGLAGTALVRDFEASAARALREAFPITSPYREVGYFAPEQPAAVGYRVRARRGQRLVVEANLEPDSTALVFLDLFLLAGDTTRAALRIASAESGSRRLEYELRRDGEYVIRLQPELLRGGRYALTVRGAGALAFPVDGAGMHAIRSSFGDPRDGGVRDHHGIDIFAPRGTPVLASVAGVVTRVGATDRGGKIVWLRDEERGDDLYYAHLDSQFVARGARVQPGDTLGLVGNTGNAAGTTPHLHFGVYRRGRVPLDPHAFVQRLDTVPAPLAVDSALIGRWTRTVRDRVPVRAAPDREAPLVARLARLTPMRVAAASGGWFRVVLPDGRTGFLAGSLAEGADAPVRSEVLADARPVRDRPAPPSVVMDTLEPGRPVPVLGRFGDYLFVQAPSGRTGWLPVDVGAVAGGF